MHTGRPALSPRSTPPPPPIFRPRIPIQLVPQQHSARFCMGIPAGMLSTDGAGSGRAALAGVFTEVSSGGMRECCRAVTIPRPCRNDRTSQGCHARSALHGTAPQRCHAALQTVQFTDRCQTITTGPTWSCSSWSYVPPLHWRGQGTEQSCRPTERRTKHGARAASPAGLKRGLF